MNTVRVEVNDKTGIKTFKAYDANFLFDKHGFFVQISVLEKGKPQRYYFNLADCTISFHDD